jgi:acylphosphatase
VNRPIAKRYVVRGRVQGVGYRAFAQQHAIDLGVLGWVRNLEEGDVEVYAIGAPEQLSELEDCLWRGPRMSNVRGVNSSKATVEAGVHGFHIRY